MHEPAPAGNEKELYGTIPQIDQNCIPFVGPADPGASFLCSKASLLSILQSERIFPLFA
jgi:hypothetical protein